MRQLDYQVGVRRKRWGWWLAESRNHDNDLMDRLRPSPPAVTSNAQWSRSAGLAFGFLVAACGGLTSGDVSAGNGKDGSASDGQSPAIDSSIDAGKYDGATSPDSGTLDASESKCPGYTDVSCCPGFEECNGDWKWFCTRPKCSESCPEVAPELKLECDPERICVYVGTVYCFQTVCLCEDGYWRCGGGPCEPGCPASAFPGETCGIAGKTCTYGPSVCTCAASGKWSCDVPQ